MRNRAGCGEGALKIRRLNSKARLVAPSCIGNRQLSFVGTLLPVLPHVVLLPDAS
jgi:hypothetical protein